MTPSTSTRNTFILLFYLFFTFLHVNVIGYNGQKCESNYYQKSTQEIQRCERCNQQCSEDKNEKEVTPCTQTSNRVCLCKPGFYCSSGNNYQTHCHQPCVPCGKGMFRSTPSLEDCSPHTDCVQLGMIMLKEGTATQDNECANTTTVKPASSSTKNIITTTTFNSTSIPMTEDKKEVTPCTRVCICKPGFYCTNGSNFDTNCHKPCVPCGKGTFSSTASLEACSPHTDCVQLGMIMLKEGTATQDTECVNATTVKPASSSTKNIITTTTFNSTSIPMTAGVTVQLKDKAEEIQSHLLLLLILMLIILFMAGFCILMKNVAKKTLLKWFGFINRQHEDNLPWSQTASDNQILSNSQSETTIPVCSAGREVKGQSTGPMPQSGAVQQVTMEHNGKGENVSNTVGSIYIYSPGMVILGSNSGDKKEEAGLCEEGVPLISRPQQETNPPSQEVRIKISAPEEAEEELSLSFPVPATEK
ncbi:tumor necrosis factor receptor superfamily member 8 isoform X1 [Carassius carassius]|uniref:tumor necrosis factor receptor superfamily member 8 isoform X1 n=1 Tax=Carassius carassius TaxID=217509 RepID=UPI002868B80A|nr:tumor necrosis factor receptor superfamily member 8 isoform X1 [Carassius carassius]